MAEQGNQNLQGERSSHQRKERKSSRQSRSRDENTTPSRSSTKKAIGIIAGVMLVIIMLLGIVEGLNSVQMDDNEYRTAVREEAKNYPSEEEGTYEANYNLGLAIRQTLELSEIIHEAKEKEKKKIEDENDGKTVICESDQTPVLINESYPEYYPTASQDGGEIIARTAERLATPKGKSYNWADKAEPTRAAKEACKKYHSSWAEDNYKAMACSCHSISVILSEALESSVGTLLPATSDSKAAQDILEESLEDLDLEVIPYDGAGTTLTRGDVVCYRKESGYAHIYIYLGRNRVVEGSNENKWFAHFQNYQTLDADVSKYSYYFVIRKKGSGMAAGGVSTCAQDVIEGACKWAEAIVNDNEFHYGESAWSHHNGCYFCDSQPDSKKRGGGDWEKTYCCNPFVHAAYAHGGGDPEMLEICQSCSSYDWDSYPSAPMFQSLGTPSVGELQRGDVICLSYHVMLYMGDGQVAHAAQSDDGVKGSSSWDNSIRIDSVNYYYGEAIGVYRYIGNGGGTMEIPSASGPGSGSNRKTYDSVTNLKTISKQDGKMVALPKISGHAIQSFAYHNGLYYLQEITHGRYGKGGYIVVVDENGNEVRRSDHLDLRHGQDLTYNAADGFLYSATTAFTGDNKVLLKIDPNSLEIVGSVSTGAGASSVGYDRLTRMIATQSSKKNITVFDASFKEVNSVSKVRPFDINSQSTQGMGAYGGTAYLTTFDRGGNNFIDMYDMTSGDYYGSYEAPYDEIEDIDFTDSGEIVLLFHSGTAYMQFTGINADGAVSDTQNISMYTTKHDLDVLSAYSITLSNTGLFKTEEKTEGDNKTWIDRLSDGAVGTDNYTDIKGRRLKLYWFGEKRGRVNYKADLKKKLGEGWFRKKQVYFYKVIDDPDEARTAMREDGVREDGQSSSDGKVSQSSDWRLVLVNRDNAVPSTTNPTLADVSSYSPSEDYKPQVDSRIKDSLIKMLTDCEGTPRIYSAYRTSSEQEDIYEREPEATKNLVMKAGYSEHQTGLAVDILEKGTAMDATQENQEAQKWLMKNCSKYGFILRYPKDKEAITGVGYEPWHYRYVGEEAAKEITERGISLEEYLGVGTSSSDNSGEIIYLRERPLSDILADMDMDPQGNYSGSGQEGMFDATNLEAAIGMSDNTEHILYTRYMDIDRSGKTLMNLGSGDFGLPLEKGTYTITSHVGRRNAPTAGASTNHSGVDMAAPAGTPVYASLSGTVTVAQKTDNGGYGKYVEVSSGEWTIIYGHLSEVLVEQGSTVTKGQNIGKVGSTGISTGNHLHFEVHKNGKVVDPEEFMDL